MEDQPPGLEEHGVRFRILVGIQRAFRHRHVPGLGHESLELAVGDGMRVDPKAVDGNSPYRRFFGVVPFGPHGEGPPRNPNHRILDQRLLMHD
ncbi:hypothetical protein D3C72_2237840 [compost metagenome]